MLISSNNSVAQTPESKAYRVSMTEDWNVVNNQPAPEAVPEPSTILGLLSFGVLGWGWRRKQRSEKG